MVASGRITQRGQFLDTGIKLPKSERGGWALADAYGWDSQREIIERGFLRVSKRVDPVRRNYHPSIFVSLSWKAGGNGEITSGRQVGRKIRKGWIKTFVCLSVEKHPNDNERWESD